MTVFNEINAGINIFYLSEDALLGTEPRNTPRRQFTQSQGLGGRRDCLVTEWSAWSACSATCGDGIVRKFRSIEVQPENGGRACPRQLVKQRRCRGPACY